MPKIDLIIGAQVKLSVSTRKHFPTYRSFEGTIIGESNDQKKWIVKWPHLDEPASFYKSYLISAQKIEKRRTRKFTPYRVTVSATYPQPRKGGIRRRAGTAINERRDLVLVKWDGVALSEWLDRRFITTEYRAVS